MKKQNSNIEITQLTEEQKAKTRKLSIIEGSACSVMSGAGDTYITPYALELQANNAQVGYLSSFTGLLGPVSQVFGSKLMEKYPRKKIVLAAVILQATMWLAMIALGFVFLTKGKTFYLIPLLIAAYVLYALFGAFGGPAWFSLMGDVVPEKIRGAYFSNRNRICGSFSLTAAAFAAILLYYTKEWSMLIYGFIILFAISSIARFISAYFFSKHFVAPIKLEKGYYFSFWQFIKKAPYNNFGKFTIFVSLITFSVNIAGPFFAVYMWKDLGFNPIWFTAVNLSAGLFQIIFFPLWGKFSEKYGNRELLKVGALLIFPLPFLWLFSESPVYLILVPQLISGIGWGAFNLATSNFIYDAVTVQRRAICVAYFNLLNGIGVFAGALIGAMIAQYAPVTFMNIFLFIFIISTITRLMVIIFMFNKIKEVRQVSCPPKSNPFLYIYELKNFYLESKHWKPHYGSLKEKAPHARECKVKSKDKR